MNPRLTTIVLLALAACRPEFGPPESSVTGLRILAVRADPPEARPGEPVSYEALVVGPEGRVEAPAPAWAFCASPRPLTENTAVSVACLGDGVRAIGDASAALTPADACQLFGPDPPPGGLRPRAPDSTGGFSQPVRVRVGGVTAFRLERVECELPDAPLDAAIELSRRYQRNQNPTLSPLEASVNGQQVSLDSIPAGATVRFRTGWASGDAESYVIFDPDSATLVERTELLTVAWFVTAGSLSDEVTGSVGGEPVSETTWLAPEGSADVWLWTVARDDRGGVDFAGHALHVGR